VASDIATALIAAAGGLIVAGASYWFTKKRERDAELRKEKLNHYKELVASMGRIIANESTSDDQREFARASNNLSLVASQSVLAAFREFRLAIGANSVPQTQDRHDTLLTQLLREIRKDLAVTPRDDSRLQIALWSSGVQPQVDVKRDSQRARSK
jgi:hypothetical protein